MATRCGLVIFLRVSGRGRIWPPMNKVLSGIIVGKGQLGKILHLSFFSPKYLPCCTQSEESVTVWILVVTFPVAFNSRQVMRNYCFLIDNSRIIVSYQYHTFVNRTRVTLFGNKTPIVLFTFSSKTDSCTINNK